MLVWTRAVCLALASTVLVLLLLILLDASLKSDSIGIRLLCMAACFTTFTFTFAKWILPVLNYRPERVDIARRIENTSPDWQNELTTSVELAARSGPPASELESQLIDRSLTRLKQTPGSLVGNPNSIVGSASLLMFAGAIGGLLFASQKPLVLHSLKRIAMPWSQADWPRENKLAIANLPTQMQRSESLPVTAWDENEKLNRGIRVEYRTGSRSESMELSPASTSANEPGSPQQFTGLIRNVQEDISLRVIGGDDRTEWHSIHVVDLPELVSSEVYSRHQDYDQSDWQRAMAELTAWPESELRVHGSANMNLTSASIVFQCDDDLQRESLVLENGRRFSSRTSLRVPAADLNPIQCWIELVSVDGVASQELAALPIQLLQDQPPFIAIKTPEKLAGLNSIIPVEVLIQDELPALAAESGSQLHLHQNQFNSQALKANLHLEMNVAEPSSDDRPFAWQSNLKVDMTNLETFQIGDRLIIAALAVDRAGNAATSPLAEVRIVPEEQLMEQVTRWTNLLARTIDELQTQQSILKTRTQRFVDSDSTEGRLSQLRQIVASQTSINRLFGSGPRSSVGINQMLLAYADRHRLIWPGLQPLIQVREIQQQIEDQVSAAIVQELNSINTGLKLHSATDQTWIDLRPLLQLQAEKLQLIDRAAELVKASTGFEEISNRIFRLRDQQATVIGDTAVARQQIVSNPRQNIERQTGELLTEQTRLRSVTEKALRQMKEFVMETGGSEANLQRVTDAQTLAESGALLAEMLAAESSLANQRPGRALDAQQRALGTLEEMASLLANNTESTMQGISGGLAQQINDITQKLEQFDNELRQQTENGTEMSEAVRQQLDARKKEMERQLTDLQSALQASQFANLQDLIQDAIESVARSSNAVDPDSVAKESQSIQKAISQLQQAALAIAEQAPAAPDDKTDLTKVLEFLNQLHIAQQNINRWTQSQPVDSEDSSPPSAESDETLQQYVDLQKQVANSFDSIAENLRQYPTATIMTRSISSYMDEALKRLRERTWGTETRRIQQRIVDEIQLLIEAIEIQLESNRDNSEVESENADNEQGPEASGISSFELTMLYVMQQSLMNDSEKLALQIRESGSETDELRAIRIELGQRQSDIANVLGQILEKANPQESVPSLPDF